MKQLQKNYSCVYSVTDVMSVAEYLYGLKDECAIYTFTGSLGAGKTTMVQALLQCYGVTEAIVSPTFTYMNTYSDPAGCRLYHFDLYRLISIDAFITAGFDEYLYQSASWTFIEWPEIVQPILHDRVCRVVIEYENLEQRRVTCHVV